MKKVKYWIIPILILCFYFLLNVKIINNNYGSFSIYEIAKIKYMTGTIELNENPYYESLSAALANAHSGETVYISGNIDINENILIPAGVIVEIKESATINIMDPYVFQIEGTLYQKSSTTLNVSGDIQIGYGGVIDSYGSMLFDGLTASLTTYERAAVNQYGTIILRNGSSFLGDENFVDVFGGLENVKIENYGATITDQNVIQLFRESNIITSHGLHVVGTQTYYDTFNDIPQNTDVELTTFLYLTDNQTIQTGVTVNVLANNPIVCDKNLAINGTLKTNGNYLQADSLSGSGKLYIKAASDPNYYLTKTNSVGWNLTLHIDGDIHYGYSILELGYDVEDITIKTMVEDIKIDTMSSGYYALSLGTHKTDYGQTVQRMSNCPMDRPGCKDYTGNYLNYYISATYSNLPNKTLYECILDEYYKKTNGTERPEGWYKNLNTTELNSITKLTCNSVSSFVDKSLINLDGINKLANLETLELADWPLIKFIDFKSLPSKLKNISIDEFTGLEMNNSTFYNYTGVLEKMRITNSNIGILSMSHIKSLKEIYLENNEIEKIFLPEEANMTSIYVKVADNAIKTVNRVDLPANLNNLVTLVLDLEHNNSLQINGLNLSNSTKLEELKLNNTNLHELELGNSPLKKIDLSNNHLQGLEIKNPELVEELNLFNNDIENDNFNDFDDFTSLEVLNIENNSFTSFSAPTITNPNNLSVEGNNFVIQVFLDETQVEKIYDYSNDYFDVGFEQTLRTSYVGEKPHIGLTEGLNTKGLQYKYTKQRWTNIGNIDNYDYIYEVRLEIIVPNIKSEEYEIDKTNKAIYIGSKNINNVLSNITKVDVSLTKNNNTIELRHDENDKDAFSTYKLIGYTTSKTLENNTISYVEKTKVNEVLSSFEGLGDTIVKVYDSENNVIEDTDSYASTGMSVKLIYNDKIYDSIDISVEYIELNEEALDEENELINIPLGAQISNLEDFLQTSGVITYYDKNAQEISVNEDTTLKTGMIVKITLSDRSYQYYLSVKGDVTGSGASTISDVMRIVSYILDDNIFTHNCYYLAADMNKDGNVSISDIMVIISILLG